jgi:hypothetical protein
MTLLNSTTANFAAPTVTFTAITVGSHRIDEAILEDLLEARGFIDYVCKVDPRFAELWSAYTAKERILR